MSRKTCDKCSEIRARSKFMPGTDVCKACTPLVKKCARCLKSKQVDHFHNDKNTKDGLNCRCIFCAQIFFRNNRDTYDEKLRKRCHKYGITLKKYKKMEKEQGHRCALCNREEYQVLGLCIDHDHVTKVVRGLLCSRCNTGLGMLGDSLESLRSVVAYLERSE